MICEHCGAPAKGVRTCGYATFLSQSGWTDLQVHNWQKSGADSPCSFDEYDEGQREIAARERRFLIRAMLTFLVIAAFLIWLFS